MKVNSLLSVRFLFLLLYTVLLVSCKANEYDQHPKLIEYPIPFYKRTLTNNKHCFYGIETKRFKLINNEKGSWLLYDNLIDPQQRNNLEGLDEYIFIQLDLEKQLGVLMKNRCHVFLMPYRFVNEHEE